MPRPATSPLTYQILASPLGTLTAVARDEALLRLSFAAEIPPGHEQAESELLGLLASQLDEYFSGTRRQFELPLDLVALTPFARSVLVALSQIPYGATQKYATLARAAGHPGAARAVGSVMARNPLPIILPCHRVLPAAGGDGNYAGGPKRKRWLLDLERA